MEDVTDVNQTWKSEFQGHDGDRIHKRTVLHGSQGQSTVLECGLIHLVQEKVHWQAMGSKVMNNEGLEAS